MPPGERPRTRQGLITDICGDEGRRVSLFLIQQALTSPYLSPAFRGTPGPAPYGCPQDPETVRLGTEGAGREGPPGQRRWHCLPSGTLRVSQ